MLTLQTAASALPHPSAATVRLALTESEAAKIGKLDCWRAAKEKQAVRRDRKLRRIERQANAADELRQLVAKLLQHAESEEWSQRTLASKIQIPERTFRRLRDGLADPLTWLPRVQAALVRFTPLLTTPP